MHGIYDEHRARQLWRNHSRPFERARRGMDIHGHWASSFEYVDFDLEIASGDWPTYAVSARWLGAVAHATMTFPYTPHVLENTLLRVENILIRTTVPRRRVNTPEQEVVEEFGRTLFDTLLTGSVRSAYEVCRQTAHQQGKGVRLRLRFQPPELAVLPWEFLYDSHRDEFICQRASTPLVRFVHLPEPGEQLRVPPPLRVLGMVTSPSGLARLDVEHEKERIEQATAELRQRGLLDLTWLEGQTWRALQRAMRRGRWHVFHFIGHGGFDPVRDEGLIALASETGQLHQLPAADLAALLDDHRPLRLVLLNSCSGAQGSKIDIFSSTAASLIRRGIPAVLAMQYEISDTGAIEFARTFYEAIADGLPVDTAVCEARVALNIEMSDSFEWAVPVLYLRSTDASILAIESASQPLPSPGPSEPPTEEQEPELAAQEQKQRLTSLYDEARSAYDAKQWGQAVETLQEILSLQPDYQDAASLLADVTRQQQELAQHWTDSRRAYEAGSWAEAIRHVEAVLAEDADYEDAARLLEDARRQLELARLYAEAGRLHDVEQRQAVVEISERIQLLDPDYPDPDGLWTSAGQQLEQERELDTFYRRAVQLVEDQDWERADKQLKGLQRRSPGYRDVELLLNRVQKAIGDHQREQQLISLYEEAQSAYDAKQWEKADKALREIIALQPNYRDAEQLLAEVTHQQQELAQHRADGRRAYEAGAWLQAIRHLEAVVAMDPSNEEAVRLLDEARRQQEVAELHGEARRLHASKQWQRVVEVFEQIQALDPDYPDPDGLLASARQQLEQEHELDTFYHQALGLIEAQDWEQAAEQLEEIRRRRLNYRDVTRLLDRVQHTLADRERERQEQAEPERKHLEAVMAVETGDEEAAKREQEVAELYGEARRLHASKQWQAVVEVFEIVQALDPEYRDPEVLLASARRQLRVEQELDPFYRRAVRLVEAEEWERAAQQLDALQQQRPGYRNVDVLLGRARQELTKRDEPQQALQRQQGDSSALQQRGDITRQPQAAIGSDAPEWLIERLERRAAARRARETQAAVGVSGPDETQAAVGVSGPEKAAGRMYERERKRRQLGSLYAKADAAYEAKQWERAAELLRDIIALQPDYRDAEHLLAKATRQRERQEQAELERMQQELAKRDE